MPDQAAPSFATDPRVLAAKRAILDALKEHQARLTGVRPPDPARKQSYAETIKEFNELRGGAIYYPYLGAGFGRGPLVELADGSVKYDLITGIGVHALGHNHPALVEAALDAALSDTIMQGNLQQNVECAVLSKSLVDLACGNGADLPHVFLASSGAMANENALKIIFQKKHPASRLLAFEHCFAGRSMVLSQITDKPSFRVGLPKVVDVDYVPFYDVARPKESTDRAVEVLRSHLLRYPGQHAAMIMELVLGEGGYYPGSRDFFLALIGELKAANAAIWADEIQTFGRTSEPFAFQHFGIDDKIDICTVGKMTQVCATFFRDEFKPKPGLISQTFTASTSAIRAAQAILHVLTTGGVFGKDGLNARFHASVTRRLEAMAAKHPTLVAGPFGYGAMAAFTPFAGDADKVKKFLAALFDDGVIAFVGGDKPARVRFLMPAIAMTDADLDAAFGIIEQTLVQVAKTL